jgi:biopolymer transport protein ExbD
MSGATRFARYRLRSLLMLITVVAIVLGFVRLRPSSTVNVELHANGSASIAGKKVDLPAMQQCLEAELATRRRWLIEGSVVVQADRDASFKALSGVLESARRAGAPKLAISAKDYPNPANRP